MRRGAHNLNNEMGGLSFDEMPLCSEEDDSNMRSDDEPPKDTNCLQSLLNSERLKKDIYSICEVKEDSLLGKTFIRLCNDKLRAFLVDSLSRLQIILD